MFPSVLWFRKRPAEYYDEGPEKRIIGFLVGPGSGTLPVEYNM